MSKICNWAKSESEIKYHNDEWCKPEYDDHKIFEMLILEGMQAGLSWSTILNKRENMREAFDDFEPSIIAKYGEEKIEELMANAGIIRNKRKIAALVSNAQAYLNIQSEYGSFNEYIWEFVNGEPIINKWESIEQIPATNDVSDKMSKELKNKGFKFVGSTICYSFMQAIGMVNDHMIWCEFYN